MSARSPAQIFGFAANAALLSAHAVLLVGGAVRGELGSFVFATNTALLLIGLPGVGLALCTRRCGQRWGLALGLAGAVALAEFTLLVPWFGRASSRELALGFIGAELALLVAWAIVEALRGLR